MKIDLIATVQIQWNFGNSDLNSEKSYEFIDFFTSLLGIDRGDLKKNCFGHVIKC